MTHYTDWNGEAERLDKKTHWRRLWWLYVIVAAIVMVCIIGMSWAVSSAQKPAKAFTVVTHSASATPSHAAPQGARTTFDDGTWLVGRDIKPGKYKATVPADSYGCYWARQKESHDADQIIENHVAMKGQTIVTIKKTDYTFDTNGCGTWTPLS
jgi:hypothetical protein